MEVAVVDEKQIEAEERARLKVRRRLEAAEKRKRTARGLLALLVVVAAVVVYATVTAGPSEAQLAQCLEVPEATLISIATGLDVVGGGSLRDGWAVRSEDGHFVAAEIDGPGIEGDGDIGLWYVAGELGASSAVLAADHVAREFSFWGRAMDDDRFAEFRQTVLRTPAAETAVDCVGWMRG